ncbi:bifunctional phosphoribosylaminoimidazolecarboxamide formyltransferase/IMP cyclohydrolase [Pseudothermotoga thermarum]|uniref:Bifunctional purine biosynthesis protein PurH n=1 Tax=Pseudothermotoga thermarum DSM 5069 TaxID=688269 RepID=F7YWW3_9THEM|nr:bifunctional phosphoribosylaminoimidazolecarboxamide formyltransferase/IMP cyclohydrolase [Pseudothermotoga thermarum]AEH50555.1 IMP cyclohydrolase; phosphoribosylaminoimidazolecarboxamide formyltransferase [Pseudothermotoga thermarum DSM 5069]
MVKRALISVYDKTSLLDFAKFLFEQNVEIISSGGTARFLKENGIPVKTVEEITGFPEILEGRVKTLHPKIHGAILADRSKPLHLQQLEQLGIETIDMVVVNLYPFEKMYIANASDEEMIENIDIGGPTLIRAAAKNYKNVAIVCDPKDYPIVVDEIKQYGEVRLETRLKLAQKAFELTSYYDSIVARYFRDKTKEIFPEFLTLGFKLHQTLRYGENPHQMAAAYVDLRYEGTIMDTTQLWGKELSFNNIADADAALSIVKEFTQPCAVGVKHTNPCGVACGETLLEAFEKMYEADPISIFGGIVALNRTVDEKTAEKMSQIFLEVVIAPDYDPKALEILMKKKNLRILKVKIDRLNQNELDLRKVSGGLLVQTPDSTDYNELRCVTKREPTPQELEDLLFAWKVVKHVKSNAIVLAKNLATVGIGAGQVNRLWPTEHCVRIAGPKANGAVLASDAFFPFPDAVEVAAKAGVTAIIQPGGSIRDEEVIKVANEYNIAMIFTGTRHFKH